MRPSSRAARQSVRRRSALAGATQRVLPVGPAGAGQHRRDPVGRQVPAEQDAGQE